MQQADAWQIAVFAHNEADRIAACLDSILAATDDRRPLLAITVLANGCSDDTAAMVEQYRQAHPEVRRVELPIADKANAWNHYVHGLAQAGGVHFFVDADVRVERNALISLQDGLVRNPRANAAAAVPANGRDAAGWTRRMIEHGRVSGGLYALRGSFVQTLRSQATRLPTGLVGDDFLLSAIAKQMPYAEGLYRPGPGLIVETDARFRFCELRPTRPGHWLPYFRRLVRYRIRGYQLAMLFDQLGDDGFPAMPADMGALYCTANQLPGYYWRGSNTLVDFFAVRQIRQKAAEAGNA